MNKSKLDVSRLFYSKKFELDIHKLNTKLDFSRTKVGIQIGDSILKIILAEREKGQWIVKKEIAEILAQGLVSEGRILQPEILGLKIRETLNNHSIKINKAALFIEELPFFLREIKLGIVPKRELSEAIQYRVQPELPVDSKDLFIQYSLLDRKEVDGKVQEDYMVIAVYKSYIEKAVQTFKQADLKIESFAIEPEAIYEGLVEKGMVEHNNDDALLLVRKDSKRMLLAIYAKEKLMYSRYIPVPADFNEEVSDAITRTIISWNGKRTNGNVKEVVLLGEEVGWNQIRDDVQAFMSFLDVKIVTSLFTACLGVTLIDQREEFINIKPREESTKQFKRKAYIYSFIGIVAFTILLIIISEFQLRQEIKTLTNDIEHSGELLNLITYREELLKEKETLELIKAKSEQEHIDAVLLINNINKHLPESVKLAQITFSTNTVVLGGSGDTQEDVIALYKNLQIDDGFSNVHLSQSSSSNEMASFSIELQFNRPLVSEDK